MRGLRLNQSETAALFGLKDPKSIRNWERRLGFPRPVLRNGPRVEYDVSELADFSRRTRTPIDPEAAQVFRIPSELLADFHQKFVAEAPERRGEGRTGAALVRARIVEEIRAVCDGRYHGMPPNLKAGLEGLAREGDGELLDSLASLLCSGHRRRRRD